MEAVQNEGQWLQQLPTGMALSVDSLRVDLRCLGMSEEQVREMRHRWVHDLPDQLQLGADFEHCICETDFRQFQPIILNVRF